MSVVPGPTTLDPYSGLDAAAAQAQMGAINAAGPDVFDNAQASMRDTRRSLLESIAAAGSAGRAEYQRQAEQSAAMRQQQVSGAVAAATTRNADAGTIAALQQQIGRPYDEATSARDANQANWQNLFAATGVSNAAYMDKYIGSMPLIQQQFKGDLATKFALARSEAQRDIEKTRQGGQLTLAELALRKAESDAEARARADMLKREDAIRLQEWARQDTQRSEENAWRQKEFDEDVRRFGLEYALDQQRLAASRSGSGGGGPTGFFGTGYDKGELQAALPGAVNSVLAGFKKTYDPANVTGSTFAKIVGFDKGMQGVAANTINNQLGLPPGVVGSLLPKYSSGIRWPDAPPTTAIQKLSPSQRGAYDYALQALKRGLSPDDLLPDADFGFDYYKRYGESQGVKDAVALAIGEYWKAVNSSNRTSIMGRGW